MGGGRGRIYFTISRWTLAKETLQQFCCKRSIAFTNGTRKVHTSDTRDGKYYKVQMDKGKRPVLLIQINGWE